MQGARVVAKIGGKSVADTRADESGRFQICGLSAARAEVVACHDAFYTTRMKTAGQPVELRMPLRFAGMICGLEITDARLPLREPLVVKSGVRVTGRVVDETGVLVRGAEIMLWRACARLDTGGAVRSGSDGRFVVQNVPTRDVFVAEAWAKGFSTPGMANVSFVGGEVDLGDLVVFDDLPCGRRP